MRRIVVCTTCKFPDGRKVDDAGVTGGMRMVAAMTEANSNYPHGPVQVDVQACMWNCTRSCSVLLQDDERFSYITGGHEPTVPQAEAILSWFHSHAATDTGEVPFRQWPDAMRGHFIARMPPQKRDVP
jgi:predicted metal-binding protein